jgi:hypothetical protein
MKMTRRDFLGVASGTVAVAASLAKGAIVSESATDLVVYNEWYAPAREFASTWSRRGAIALPMKGDAGVLWYGELRSLIAAQHSAQNGLRIAGMGTHTDFFIFQTLGREAGLRTQLAGRHDSPLVSWVMTSSRPGMT